MRLLAVDTTTPSGSVALLEDERLVGEWGSESQATHSSRLLHAVEAVLQASGMTIEDVDAFAVAAGPGSFTGIRIGLSTVKSLVFASGKPLAAVSSLRALALKAAGSGTGLVASVMDAKKGEIYAALFRPKEGDLEEILPQGAYSPGEFVARLPVNEKISFLGGGLYLCREALETRLGGNAEFPSRTPFIAHEVGLLGFRELRRGGGVKDGGLEPFYFRRSQAEENH